MILPETPVYGLPYEALNDQPGHSLHGGLSGTEPILAEAVETELERIDQAVDDNTTALARGWHDIVEGDLIAEGQVIPIDPGVYDKIRIECAGSLDGGSGTVTMRVNQDQTLDMHQSSWMTFNPATQLILDGNNFDGTSWTVGKWNSLNGNSLELTLLATDISTLIPFTGSSFQAGDTTVRRITEVRGRLASARRLEALQFFGVGFPLDSNFRVWVEGHAV